MRNLVKGGVWKNVEDEILKAAVMKYGLNQWSRIASLLTRKTAKQCKARWQEWLDPSVKKTEWTREEDEKLLHLAKIFPTQWRTIAPIVGRTPAQCLERYEKLLDQAQGKEDEDADIDDPRKLRPGEIDPFPETKPARPDAIDMDEDEKEMLNEARARLANTRGKKAKRKAREKQLDEARRLASLQKKRELRAAGIGAREARVKIKGIDYNKEIAFEKQPQPGFYDISNEPLPTTKNFRVQRTDELEGPRRMDEELEKRKQDAAKQKKRKEDDLPSAILQFNEMETSQLGKRSKLNLPAPQVTEAEMEEVAKSGLAAALPGATPLRALASGMTPVRSTPMMAGKAVGATPRGTAVGLTPGSTPIRDEFGINSLEQDSLERGRQSAIRSQLRAGLSSLPKPSGEYSVVLADASADDDAMEQVNEDYDQADIDRQHENVRNAKLLLRSEAVKQGLPRPARVPRSIPSGRYSDAVCDLIDKEVLALMNYDLLAYPVDGSAMSEKKPPSYIDDFSADQLQTARLMIAEESEVGDVAAMVAAIARLQESSLWVPHATEPIRRETASDAEKVAAYKYQLAQLQDALAKESKKAAKAEQKAQVLVGGYIHRNGALDTKIADLMKEVQRRKQELEPLKQLYTQEKLAIPQRLTRLQKEVEQIRLRENDLQVKYSNLMLSRDAMIKELQS